MTGRRTVLSFLMKAALFLSALFLFAVFPGALSCPETPRAESVLVYNLENDTVLYRKTSKEGRINAGDASPSIYPASTAKIMTALIALEHYDSLESTVTVTSEMIKNVTGNNIALKKGEELSVGDLLKAVIVGGANDAANVLAFDISGNQADFVRKMNEKAREIGMEHTNYTNPYGIHNNSMTTTLDDTLLLAVAAFRNAVFTEISSLAKVEIPATSLSKARTVHNRNALLSRARETKYYTENVIGMNAGSTEEAGNCLITARMDRGLSFLCIVMGAEETEEEGIWSYLYARELLDWAQDAYSYLPLIDKAAMICELPVALSADTDHVTLRPQTTMEKYLPSDTDLAEEISYTYRVFEEELAAPVEAGEVVGEMTLFYQGEEIGKIGLITNNSVDRTEFLYLLHRIELVVTSKPFLIAATLLVILILFFLLAVSRRRAVMQAQARGKKKRKY